jgi:hypothetical protein
LNSIDENETTDEIFDESSVVKRRCSDFYSNLLPEKRQSDPAIRFSFYNKWFDTLNDNMQELSSPMQDFRKFSLPLSMNQPSMSSSSSNAFHDVSSWRSYNSSNGRKATKNSSSKFSWTVNDEEGHEIKNSLFDTLSPMEDFIDEQCLHFEENFVNIERFDPSQMNNFDDLNDKIAKKWKEYENEIFFQSQSSTETVIEKICKKCGHDILRL